MALLLFCGRVAKHLHVFLRWYRVFRLQILAKGVQVSNPAAGVDSSSSSDVIPAAKGLVMSWRGQYDNVSV